MALIVDETRLPGTGNLYLAPVGTTLPAADSDPTAALNAAFIHVGYIAEDGVTVKSTVDLAEFGALQSVLSIRRSRKTQNLEITADLLQWFPETVIAAFGGGSFSGSSFPTYTFPVAGEALAEYSVVLDMVDGAIHDRYAVPRMNSGLADVEVKYNRDNLAVLPLTLRSLASTTPTIWITDGDTAGS